MLIALSLFFFLAGVAAMGAIFHFLVRRYKKHIDTIANTPLTGVGHIQAGLAKARGKSVANGKLLVSPLTQTKCVFYHFKVDELRSSTSSNTTQRASNSRQQVTSGWVTVINDKQAIPSGIQDETGMAGVDLLNAEMVLTTSKPKQSSFWSSCPPELKETLAKRYNFSTKGLLLSKSLQFTEMLIRPGDDLLVVGDVDTKAGRTPTFVKGNHSFVVSDQEESQVLRHFARSTTGAYVVMGLVGVITLFATAVPIYIRSSINPTKQPAKEGQAPDKKPKK
jgi:hypothetical protein